MVGGTFYSYLFKCHFPCKYELLDVVCILNLLCFILVARGFQVMDDRVSNCVLTCISMS